MPPRTAASTPNLSEARKSSLPSLGDSAFGSTSTESLASLTRTGVKSKMTSVRQRAKDLEQLAASRRQTAFSPRTSPPPSSPFVKMNTIGAQFVVPQIAPNRSTITEGDLQRGNTSAESLNDSIRQISTVSQATSKQGNSPATVEEEAEWGAENNDASQAASESSEEDEDETPRQSTNYSEVPAKVIRQDSSRQANYSLKPRKYSPELDGSERAAAPAAPRLPELYFQDSIVEDAVVEPVTQSQGSTVAEYKADEAADNVINVSSEQGEEDGAKNAPVTPPAPDDLDANNHTFYWPSPHDSTDETDEGSDNEEHSHGVSAPMKSHDTLTSATALGRGGPSDWEHFYAGDYETEVIDDTDLYLTKRERGTHKNEGYEEPRQEGPTEVAEDEDAIGDNDSSISEVKDKEDSGLRTVQEHARSEEVAPNQQRQSEVLLPTSDDEAPDQESPSRPANVDITPRPEGATVRSQASKETVRPALAENDYEATAQDERSRKPSDEIEEGMGAEPATNQIFDDVSKTPPPSSIPLPSNEVGSPGKLLSGPSSPSVDDPNASEITISMVLPPDFDPRPLEPKLRDVRDAPSQMNVVDMRKSLYTQAEEYSDPYRGLSPTSKASLNRFIRMLREEEGAVSDHSKYHVFLNFVRRESKLRATLYDMDEESESSRPPSARQSLSAGLLIRSGRQPSIRQKPLPVPPEDRAPTDVTIGRTQSMLASGISRRIDDHQDKPTEIILQTTPVTPPSARESESGHTPATSASAKAQRPESSQPRLPIALTDAGQVLTHQTSLETLNRSIDLVAPPSSTMVTSSASSSRPSLDKSTDQRQSTASSPLPGAQILEQSLASNSTESKPYDGNKATNRQSIYRPFSGMLRSSSSNRRASVESNVTIRSSERPSDEKGKKTGSENAIISKSSRTEKESSVNRQRTSALDSLMAIIPQTNVLREEHRQLSSLRFDMDNIRDDFSFIHKTVLAWDSEAKMKRELYEGERQKRNSENERRVDELFNENEIGYGDISHLEDEFKKSESNRKAEEEREEVESFVAGVFDIVWARINYEMDHLTPLYREATKMVAEASAGKQMFEDIDNRVPIAPIMEILLILYQKLMIRHQKAFEAVLERDRRLKKTETSPWFNLGEFERVKRIEKRFEDAEKKAILEFCRERDERANQLMDVLDSHTLRGVGANQDYMESIMQAVRRLSIQIAAKNDGNKREKPRPSRDDVFKAKLVTTALSRSSEQIVRTFHVADMLLNAADYEVSVANAKLSNAEGDAFKRLREAKAKEDSKLAADLEHRLGLIRSDTSRTQEEVAKLVLLLGEADTELKFDIGKERDKRMIVALEDALKRDLPPPPPEK